MLLMQSYHFAIKQPKFSDENSSRTFIFLKSDLEIDKVAVEKYLFVLSEYKNMESLHQVCRSGNDSQYLHFTKNRKEAYLSVSYNLLMI